MKQELEMKNKELLKVEGTEQELQSVRELLTQYVELGDVLSAINYRDYPSENMSEAGLLIEVLKSQNEMLNEIIENEKKQIRHK